MHLLEHLGDHEKNVEQVLLEVAKGSVYLSESFLWCYYTMPQLERENCFSLLVLVREQATIDHFTLRYQI